MAARSVAATRFPVALAACVALTFAGPTQYPAAACPFVAVTSQAMTHEMSDPHMRLTPPRSGTPADTARARRFIGDMRRVLAKYQDVHVAERDGFRMFLHNEVLPVYHFTSWRRAIDALVRFDMARPTSLLYQRAPDGQFQLIGAMYTAPATISDDSLDALIPLSFARWHAHVNWCVPPLGAAERWQERRAGRPVFGPDSPIATRPGCDSVGGLFRPRIHDWSVHVYAFAGDDPKAIWCVDQHHEEAEVP